MIFFMLSELGKAWEKQRKTLEWSPLLQSQNVRSTGREKGAVSGFRLQPPVSASLLYS